MKFTKLVATTLLKFYQEISFFSFWKNFMFPKSSTHEMLLIFILLLIKLSTLSKFDKKKKKCGVLYNSRFSRTSCHFHLIWKLLLFFWIFLNALRHSASASISQITLIIIIIIIIRYRHLFLSYAEIYSSVNAFKFDVFDFHSVWHSRINVEHLFWLRVIYWL